MTPRVNILVPSKLIPAPAELPVVAPVMAQVSAVTVQLSLNVGSIVAMDLLQPAMIFWLMLDGQLTAGLILSVTVTVKVHVAVLFEASLTVYFMLVTPMPKV